MILQNINMLQWKIYINTASAAHFNCFMLNFMTCVLWKLIYSCPNLIRAPRGIGLRGDTPRNIKNSRPIELRAKFQSFCIYFLFHFSLFLRISANNALALFNSICIIGTFFSYTYPSFTYLYFYWLGTTY